MRHPAVALIGGLVVAVGWPALGRAQRVSDSAEITARGTLEVETDYAQSRGDGGLINSGSALVKYSLSDALQLQLGTDNLITVQTGAATGLLDGVYFGPKLMLVTQTERRPAIAVSAQVALPTRGDAEALTQTVDAYLWGYLSKDLLGLHADLNVGLDVLSVDVQPAVQLVAAAALSRDLPHDLNAALEVYTCEGGGVYADHDAGALTALSYAPTGWLTVQAGADVALYRDVRSLTLFAGLTFVPYQRARPPERVELAASR